jgi:hypothetical protein
MNKLENRLRDQDQIVRVIQKTLKKSDVGQSIKIFRVQVLVGNIKVPIPVVADSVSKAENRVYSQVEGIIRERNLDRTMITVLHETKLWKN